MFGSVVLDVALGLAAFYLAMSLICSAVNEFFSALRDRRAEHLKHTLFFLFNKDHPNGVEFLRQFFTHPLIDGLTPKNWTIATPPTIAPVTSEATGASALLALEKTVNAPAYIPDTTFSHVIFDLLSRHQSLLEEAIFPALAAGAVAPQTLDAVKTVIKGARDKAEALTPGPARDALVAVVGDKAVERLQKRLETTGSFGEVWKSLLDVLDQAHTEGAKLPDGPPKVDLRAALDDLEKMVRVARAHASALERISAAVNSVSRVLRGAVDVLPEGNEKAALAAAAEKAKTALTITPTDLISVPAYWEKVRSEYEGLRGAVTSVGGPGAKKIGDLLEQEAQGVLALETDIVTIEKVRAAIVALPDSQIKTALNALVEEETTLEAAEKNVEKWFNDTMDRASGWYKRNTQVIIITLAVAITVILNADSLILADRLVRDPALREVLVQSAPAELAKAAADLAAEKAATDKPTTEKTEAEKTATEKTSTGKATAEKSAAPVDSAEVAALKKADEIRKHLVGDLKVPLGWECKDWETVRKAPWPYIPRKLLGLLATAIAISMGAPFWFDVLNKVVNIRAAGKQPEKSGDKA